MVVRRLFLVIMLFATLLRGAGEPELEVRIGVLAKRGTSIALKRWEPTARYLNAHLPGYRFRIVPASFDELPMMVSNGLIDFVITNPAIYIDLSARFGVSRIATLMQRGVKGGYTRKFGAVIFTRQNRVDLQQFEDLKGRSVAAVHERSFGGWIVAAYELRSSMGESASDFGSLSFLGTHDAVVYAVADGKYDVGIVRSGTLERMAEEGKIGRDAFRIIHPREVEGYPYALSSRLYPEWPISKAAHVPEALAKKVALVLMQMDPEDGETAGITWTIPEHYEEIEAVLREMRLPPFETYGSVTLSGIMKTYGYWVVLFGVFSAFLILLWLRASMLNRRLRAKHRELILNEEMFKGTFEQAAVGLLHVTAEGTLLRFNQKLCLMTGYSAVEFARKNLNELVYYRDLSRGLQQIEALKRGEVSHFAMQTRIVQREGGVIWTNLTVSAVRNGSGQIKYFIMAVDDISHLKELEQKIAREQHARSLILDMAGDGILGLDSSGKHTFVNPAAAKLLGYSIEEMIGRESHRMWHHTKEDGSPYPSAECPIMTVLKEGITQRGENEPVWRKDGAKLYVDFISTPIVEEGVVGAVVVFRQHLGGDSSPLGSLS